MSISRRDRGKFSTRPLPENVGLKVYYFVRWSNTDLTNRKCVTGFLHDGCFFFFLNDIIIFSFAGDGVEHGHPRIVSGMLPRDAFRAEGKC